MPARVQFGLVVPSEFKDSARAFTFLADADRALKLASGRFDSAWVVDHLQSEGDVRLEAFTTLTYLAALHPGFQFGHAVLCQSFRNPGLVAKMGATLQLLTGGRFILGMGAGGNEDEYLAYGYRFPDAGERVSQLDEAIQVVRGLWTEPRFSFNGRYHRVQDAECEPRPQPMPPLMIGAFRPQMLHLVAKHADWWNVSSTGPRRHAAMAAELDRACEKLGRDPASVRRTWIGGIACSPSRSAAETLSYGRFSVADEEDYGFAGTPGDIIEQMGEFIRQGVDYFMLDFADAPSLDGIELFLEQVLPALTS